MDDQNKYTFKVAKDANKVEIKKAIEAAYNVDVESIRTLIMPSKAKVRNTKRGAQRGRKSSFKKAIITLPFGEEIDLYGDI
jgi:large subunit ribosomal protein L23